MEKIVLLDGYCNNPGDISWDPISKNGAFITYDKTDKNQIDERIKDATMVLVNKTKLNAETLIKHPQIKYIGVMATGFDVIDIEYCKKNNITVCNIPAYSTNSVAQMTFALLLESTSQVALHNDGVHNNKWAESTHFCYWDKPLTELYGKTIGIIGNGNIAKAVIKIALAFEMKVIVAQRHNLNDTKNIIYRDLEFLYANSDIISIHVPSTPTTRYMINKESISKMKDGVIILNTARGNLVVEQDVIDALDSCKINYYCSDVLETEPPLNNQLQYHKKTIITPHIAWAAKETRIRLINIAGDNILNFLNKNTINSVW